MELKRKRKNNLDLRGKKFRKKFSTSVTSSSPSYQHVYSMAKFPPAGPRESYSGRELEKKEERKKLRP